MDGQGENQQVEESADTRRRVVVGGGGRGLLRGLFPGQIISIIEPYVRPLIVINNTGQSLRVSKLRVTDQDVHSIGSLNLNKNHKLSKNSAFLNLCELKVIMCALIRKRILNEFLYQNTEKA
jgi:hypothetical protein